MSFVSFLAGVISTLIALALIFNLVLRMDEKLDKHWEKQDGDK